MFSSVFDKTRSDAQGLLPQFMRPQESRSEVEQLVMGLSYAQRFRWFIVTLLMSVGFFALSFFVCLPVIVLRPHKFAFAFTLGSLCFTSSFAFLRGPAAHCKSTCSVERMPLTAAYWLSMVRSLMLGGKPARATTPCRPIGHGRVDSLIRSVAAGPPLLERCKRETRRSVLSSIRPEQQ
ncbi:unnamed protein product [Chrysoparadoxa australica]